MHAWKVVRKSDTYFVEDLPGEDWSESMVEPGVTPDTELFHINKYGEYVDDVDDASDLQKHLYSLFNRDDRIRDGDVFVTPFGKFHCHGVDVSK